MKATSAQVRYILSLLDRFEPEKAVRIGCEWNLDSLTKKRASEMIDYLKTQLEARKKEIRRVRSGKGSGGFNTLAEAFKKAVEKKTGGQHVTK